MASLLRTLSLTARSLSSGNVFGAFSTRASWSMSAAPSVFAPATSMSRMLGVGLTQQTRGMKVHSSVKKRCEHCKVGHTAWRVGCQSQDMATHMPWPLRRHELRAQPTDMTLFLLRIGRSTESRQATQRISVHYLQGEPSTQAATKLSGSRARKRHCCGKLYDMEITQGLRRRTVETGAFTPDRDQERANWPG